MATAIVPTSSKLTRLPILHLMFTTIRQDDLLNFGEQVIDG